MDTPYILTNEFSKIYNMKKLAIILSLVILSSCEKPRPSYTEGGQANETDNIHYMKDKRTGLCFAEKGYGSSYTMTCVPCTEEVEQLIKK